MEKSTQIPKEGSQCICLSVILIDSVYKKNKRSLSLLLTT